MSGFIPVSFWASMEWKRLFTMQEVCDDPYVKIAATQFQHFCDNIQLKKESEEYSIPPLIHFIWLGSPIPKQAKEVIKSWQKWHPNWEVMLWTDEKIATFSFSRPHLKKAFEEAEILAEKADILRLEILFQLGGIYSDTDSFCCQSFYDLITNGLTFFAGLEMNFVSESHKDPFCVASGVMGACVGNSIIGYCMDHYQSVKKAPDLPLSMRAGPGVISLGCKEAMQKEEKENILILPCSYFYPLPYKDKGRNIGQALEFAAKESMTIHLWDGSWLK